MKGAASAVFMHSEPVGPEQLQISGPTHEDCLSIRDLLSAYRCSGFQASNLGRASEIIQLMLKWRLKDEPISEVDEDDEFWSSEDVRSRTRARIFLSYTSNMASSGLRESFVYLTKNRLVDVVVSTAGGIEEDFVKCLGEFVLGSFHGIGGIELRKRGWNRIGNIYVPNENYVKFEEWLFPILDECLEKQNSEGISWTPSKLIALLGEKIANPASIYYWCWRNNIPVFCPAFTDGSIGDMLFFHSKRNPVR